MKYRLCDTEDGLDVQIDDVGAQRQELVEAFRLCQEGRCACPSPEYARLRAVEIREGPTSITIHLKSAGAGPVDKAAIARCLAFTKKGLEPAK